MRLRREAQSTDWACNHRQRLALELVGIESAFVEMGFTAFVDTHPCAHFNLDAETSAASTPHRRL